MIRAIIERHVKSGKREELMTLLREIRGACVHRRGYVSGETLSRLDDPSTITVVSNWGSLTDWKMWEQSEERMRLYEKIEPLLTEEPRVQVYRIAAAEKG